MKELTGVKTAKGKDPILKIRDPGRKQKENEFLLADIKICLLLTFIQ